MVVSVDKENTGYSRLSQTGVRKSYAESLEKRRALAKANNGARHGSDAGKGRTPGVSSTLYSGGGYSKHASVPTEYVPTSVDIATNHLQQQLEAYDERLNALRNQLRSSVDEKLRHGAGEKKEKAAQPSIVQGLVTASGQGAKELIKESEKNRKNLSGCVWKTRPFKSSSVKSSCTLKLHWKRSNNVTIRITFAEGDCVPAGLLFEHAPKATAAFKALGKVSLQKKSLKQLKHVFHLGQDVLVDRFLRISCMGHISDVKTQKYHAVSYLLISGEQAHGESPSVCDDESFSSENVDMDEAVEFRVSNEGKLEETVASSVSKVKQGRTSASRATGLNHSTPRNVWERLSMTKSKNPDHSTREVQVASSVRVSSRHRPVLNEHRVNDITQIFSELDVTGMELADMIKNVALGNDMSVIQSFDEAHVDKILSCLPTVEERQKLQSVGHFGGSNEAEEFMLELLNIENVHGKLEACCFLADLDMRCIVAQDAANGISRACQEIQKSAKLQLAIKIILNECEALGKSSRALDINVLGKLKSMPYSPKGSMIHFVAARISEASGSVKVPNIAKDMPSCASASQVALSDIKFELKQLRDGLDEADGAWRRDEPGYACVERKINSAIKRFSSTEAIVAETEAEFFGSMLDAGIDPSTVQQSPDLFLAIIDFSDELNNAHLENVRVGFLTKSKCQEEKLTPKKKHEQELSHISSAGKDHVQATSRISVEELILSSKKKRAPIDDAIEVKEEEKERQSDACSGKSNAPVSGDELSTPVRKLLQSSRALINSIDLRSPIPSPKVNPKEEKEDDIPEEDDQICEMSSPQSQKCTIEEIATPEDDVVAIEETVASHEDNKDIQPKEESLGQEEGATEIREKEADEMDGQESQKEDEDADTAEPAPAISEPEEVVDTEQKVDESAVKADISSVIDVGLAAQLLANADRVRKAREQSQSAASSPIKESSSKSDSQERENTVVSKSVVSLKKQAETLSLTPEQTRAVKALGEVIRKSLPKFSSLEADKQSGLHIDTNNLDLDKILSAIIANSGNTPTGPLARGVRGNTQIFDDHAAKELRAKENEKYRNMAINENRKALLEPIIPAPLGMGVTVSQTVSHGISPQTIARSLQSNMRSNSTSHTNSAKSTGDTVQQQSLDNKTGPKHSSIKLSVKDSIGWQQSHTQNTNSGHKYYEAPKWKDSEVRESKSSRQKQTTKPVFMAGPSHALSPQIHPCSNPDIIPEEDADAYWEASLPKAQNEEPNEECDIDSLGPTGLRLSRDDALQSSKENAALAAERMQMWGFKM
ncbi:hypothetical protein M9434_005695 [Picochlorum sp. BPE23]|nr:hypothetical protein M9434_005695 [Picochlorum sp. BPE23]